MIDGSDAIHISDTCHDVPEINSRKSIKIVSTLTSPLSIDLHATWKSEKDVRERLERLSSVPGTFYDIWSREIDERATFVSPSSLPPRHAAVDLAEKYVEASEVSPPIPLTFDRGKHVG